MQAEHEQALGVQVTDCYDQLSSPGRPGPAQRSSTAMSKAVNRLLSQNSPESVHEFERQLLWVSALARVFHAHWVRRKLQSSCSDSGST